MPQPAKAKLCLWQICPVNLPFMKTHTHRLIQGYLRYLVHLTVRGTKIVLCEWTFDVADVRRILVQTVVGDGTLHYNLVVYL